MVFSQSYRSKLLYLATLSCLNCIERYLQYPTENFVSKIVDFYNSTSVFSGNMDQPNIDQLVELTKALVTNQEDFRQELLDLRRQQAGDTKSLFEALLQSRATENSNYFTAEGIANSISEFTYDPDNGVTFQAYFRRFENIFTKRCATWSDEQKVGLLLQKLGPSESTKYTNLLLPKKPDEISFEETLKTLTNMFGERSSLFHTRFKCFNMIKEESDDFVTYAGKVNQECERFLLPKVTIDAFKCLIFVKGLTDTQDKDVRSRILSKMEQDPDITLQKITEEAQRIMNLKHDNTKIEEKDISQIKGVRQRTRDKNTFKPKTEFLCYRCGGPHSQENCFFRNKFCFRCGFRGHKSTRCTKSEKSNVRKKVKVVFSKREIEEGQKRKFVQVKINGEMVRLQLDTGSDISIINEETWKRIGRPLLTKTNKVARGVSGKQLKFKGELLCDVSFLGKTLSSKVFVLQNSSNLFGNNWILMFDLYELPINSFCNRIDVSQTGENKATEKVIKDLKNKFPRVFSEGLGECTKTEVKFELKEAVKPVFKPKRNVPFAALETVDKELERLEKLGVISKLVYSDWSSPVVIVKKRNDKIRLCADFSTGLNDCLKDHTYPLPSPEEIFAKLNGGKIFSKIDLSEAYLQVKVNEECSKILTINTHKGLFKFNRLPFGLKVAPSLFQQVMETMLAGLDFSIAYLDDVLIKSENSKEHIEHITKVFERIENYGFKLSSEKCDFFLPEIKYLGQVINAKGRRPDPKRAESIKNMPIPKNVTTLQAFLGLANYYGIYIPKMHDLRAPLNYLLKKGVKWEWTNDCQRAFEKIKSVLSSDLALTHFDPQKEIIVASDASDYGIGAVLLHKFKDGSTKPVVHASRTLLPAERNYSQIEKESLAIVYALKKFHRFIHGRPFLLQTDHRPLLSIFGSKKGIPTHTANRLQRWGTCLLNYNFKMEFLPSKELGHADGLSRLIPPFSEPLEDTVIAALRDEEDLKEAMCRAIRELPVTLDEIKIQAKKDSFIKKIKEQLIVKDRASMKTSAFSTCDEVLLYAGRVVMPFVLQKRILSEFHQGHPGISRMKALMRSYTYWPRMDNDIEKLVRSCRGCALAAKSPPIKIQPWPKTDVPWSRLHIDYAGPINGSYYLVVVDSFTKWPEVFKCRRPTSTTTINFLNELFARFGVPRKIVSDNGTQFTGSEFKNYCKSLAIEHITTSPYHPRSNGQAERFVGTFKRALKKSSGVDTERSIQNFLSVYRITPNPNTVSGMSPAELMFARKIRSIFDRLLPDLKQEQSGNVKGTTKFFNSGDKVFFRMYQNGKGFWEDGVITRRIGTVMYKVRSKNWDHKRHLNQIRPRYTKDVVEDKEVPMEVLCDTFDIPAPPSTEMCTRRTSKRKRIRVIPFSPNPKRKRY